jgi:hypothetical protein
VIRRRDGRAAKQPAVAADSDGQLELRERPELKIVRRPDGVMFLLGDRSCEIVLREIMIRTYNSGRSVDDPGAWSCGDRVQRDAVTALLFDRPRQLHVTDLAPDRLRIHRRQRSAGHAHNTSVWESAALELVWDLARRRVEITITRDVDTST